MPKSTSVSTKPCRRHELIYTWTDGAEAISKESDAVEESLVALSGCFVSWPFNVRLFTLLHLCLIDGNFTLGARTRLPFSSAQRT
jgi:hypothetical protein